MVQAEAGEDGAARLDMGAEEDGEGQSVAGDLDAP
jgi:hypothetical protein